MAVPQSKFLPLNKQSESHPCLSRCLLVSMNRCRHIFAAQSSHDVAGELIATGHRNRSTGAWCPHLVQSRSGSSNRYGTRCHSG